MHGKRKWMHESRATTLLIELRVNIYRLRNLHDGLLDHQWLKRDYVLRRPLYK